MDKTEFLDIVDVHPKHPPLGQNSVHANTRGATNAAVGAQVFVVEEA
jgi:hypothetical protein